MYSKEWNKDQILVRLSAELKTPEFRKAYRRLHRQYPAIRQYRRPELCIKDLQDTSISYPLKGNILADLVTATQSDPRLRSCGLVILSLAMWPAMDHLSYDLRKLEVILPDVFAAIHAYFLNEVMKINPNKGPKIAINLKHNVEKRVRREAANEFKYHGNAEAYSYLDANLDHGLYAPHKNRLFQIKGLLGAIPEKAMRHCLWSRNHPTPTSYSEPDLQILNDALHNLVTEELITRGDSWLISEHVLHGVELKDIALKLGVRSNVIRARFFRLRRRLHKRIKSRQRNAK